ncbi:MAG: hypothetical protein IPK50_20415 [Fibrobacterota bacterium]|nr:hypothetical protein [Fibrobacterota bacterium]QQS04620.1 MAG: hypothetical protein IPK50_20415 [Fibrobacterota bacterium]
MRIAIAALLAAGILRAEPSPDLPGVDISELGRPWGDTVTEVHRPNPERSSSHATGAWQSRTTREQLDADEVLLGLGEGAIFVPSMTSGRMEPKVTVRDSSKNVIAIASTGRRIRLPPGSYEVLVGSGSEDQRFVIPMQVVDGQTAVTPVPWSGLTIYTISPERQNIRGEYTLVRQDRFQAFGEGFGQTDERLSDLQTWIVPPGVYKLTGLASGADDLTNFVTVRLLPGEWIEYTIVMDGDKIVGGGMLPPVPLKARRQGWRFGLDVGGSLAWTREKLARITDLRTTTNLTGYTQLRATQEAGAWLTSARLQFVGGGDRQDDHWRVTPDEISAQIFTVRRITPRVGPYGRVTASSHVFPTDIDLTTDRDPLRLYLRSSNSDVLIRKEVGTPRWEAAGPFAPMELRQGTGLNIDAVQHPAFELSMQAGLAARQFLPFDAWEQQSMDNPVLQVELHSTDSTSDRYNSVVVEQTVFKHSVGWEATGDLRARLGSSASLAISPGIFWGLWPSEEMEFTMTSILSLHLTRFLSADYRYTIKRSPDKDVVNRYPYNHQVLLRFSFGA